MTQKELLYVEDAIEHEKKLITFLEEMTNRLSNKEDVAFVNKEIKTHQQIEKDFCKLLGVCANE